MGEKAIPEPEDKVWLDADLEGWATGGDDMELLDLSKAKPIWWDPKTKQMMVG